MTAQRDRTEEVVEAMARVAYNSTRSRGAPSVASAADWHRLVSRPYAPDSPVDVADGLARRMFAALPSDIRAAIRGETNG